MPALKDEADRGADYGQQREREEREREGDELHQHPPIDPQRTKSATEHPVLELS